MTPTPASILVVDDTPHNISILFDALSHYGYQVLTERDGKSALEQIKYAQPDLILLDVMMPGMNGFEVCRQLKNDPFLRDIPVIFMTALSDTIDKINGFNMGAVDYITKPFQLPELMARVQTHLTIRHLQRELEQANERLEQRVAERTLELTQALAELNALKNQLEAENTYLQDEIREASGFGEIVSRSPAFATILQKVEQVAPTPTSVLLLGESGTGKELLARAIHQRSQRKNQPLIKVNCAALPPTLFESELFGHEKGSFTGANVQKIGRFELADGGTIFLDEIGEMPLEMQVKLLRVLQEGEFERVGGIKTLKVQVRLIAATNRDLETEVEAGRFRADLYYRLNVFPIRSLPLRDRKDDIPLLVRHFCNKYGPTMNRRIETIPNSVINALMAYNWPGNVRELENIVERSLIGSTGQQLQLGDWSGQNHEWSGQSRLNLINALAHEVTPRTLEEIERDYIRAILDQAKWKVSGDNGAAQILDVIPTTLESKMKKLGIVRPS